MDRAPLNDVHALSSKYKSAQLHLPRVPKIPV